MLIMPVVIFIVTLPEPQRKRMKEDRTSLNIQWWKWDLVLSYNHFPLERYKYVKYLLENILKYVAVSSLWEKEMLRFQLSISVSRFLSYCIEEKAQDWLIRHSLENNFLLHLYHLESLLVICWQTWVINKI